MELARLLGFAGDGITFLSGVLLSWDAMRSESEFVEATKIVEGMKHPVMENVTVKLDKMIVINDKGVERVFRRRASIKAIIGTIMLSVGSSFSWDHASWNRPTSACPSTAIMLKLQKISSVSPISLTGSTDCRII